MDDLTDILGKAMKLEEEGRDFYLKAADLTDDLETKKMFYQLAEDELDHLGYVQRQYAALKCDEAWCTLPEMDKIEPIDLEAPIFPADLQRIESLSDNATLEDALVFALAAEKESFALYQQGAGKAHNAEARQLFLQLASAEMTHFNTLMQRYESAYGYPR